MPVRPAWDLPRRACAAAPSHGRGGLAYEPDSYGGALDLAVFSRDAGVLQPDTFPHAAFPLAKDGAIYRTSGPKRAAAVTVP